MGNHNSQQGLLESILKGLYNHRHFYAELEEHIMKNVLILASLPRNLTIIFQLNYPSMTRLSETWHNST